MNARWSRSRVGVVSSSSAAIRSRSASIASSVGPSASIASDGDGEGQTHLVSSVPEATRRTVLSCDPVLTLSVRSRRVREWISCAFDRQQPRTRHEESDFRLLATPVVIPPLVQTERVRFVCFFLAKIRRRGGNLCLWSVDPQKAYEASSTRFHQDASGNPRRSQRGGTRNKPIPGMSPGAR